MKSTKRAFGMKAAQVVSAFALAATAVPMCAYADEAAPQTETSALDAANVVINEIQSATPVSSGIMPLNGTAVAQPLITVDGLNYLANADGRTVTFVGWGVSAPKETLDIPASITHNGCKMAVTCLTLGGGSRFSEIWS